MKKNLTFKQTKFVEAYKTCANIRQSARAAGYSESNRSLTKILKNPDVIKMLEEHKQMVIASGRYGYEKAMKECEEAISFARDTENASAMVKAIELKTKLSGLLIEKAEIKTVGFQIYIQGFDDAPKSE